MNSHVGYVVVLDRSLREDESQATIAALLQIKGVLDVKPIEKDPMHQIAKSVIKTEILGKLFEIVRQQ